MTLLSVQDTGLASGNEHSDKYGSPYTLTWVNNGGSVSNGIVAELTFKLSAAVEEDLHIKINIPRNGVISNDGNILNPQLDNGIIYIVENHEHDYGQWSEYSSVKHSRECECGETEYQRHSWDNGEVTKEPTEDSSGITTYTCSICNATKTETIPPITVDYVPGDINGDGVFDYYDVTELYAAYQSGEVDADTMDVNNDGVVDYYDVAKLYAAYRGTATLT